MECKICGASYEAGETTCQNCGCDLPRMTVQERIAAENAKMHANLANAQGSLTSVDMARQSLLAREEADKKVFLVLKIVLILSLVTFLLPFFVYKYEGISEEIAEGLNAIVGEDIYEASEATDLSMTGFNLITSKEFETDLGMITIGRNIGVSFAFLLMAAAVVVVFLPISIYNKMKTCTSLSIGALVAIISASLNSADALIRDSFGAGFILFFILCLASAVLSAYIKATA